MRNKVIPVLVMVFVLVVGIFIGQRVSAAGVKPGSTKDPLVAKSYVDEQVAKETAELQQELKELKTQAAALEAAVSDLEKQLR